MEKSKLKIVRQDGKVIIKKKIDVGSYVIYAFIFVACIIFPFILKDARESVIFWIIYIGSVLANIYSFFSLLLGEIAVDEDKREISVYSLRKNTHSFDDVKEIKGFFEEGDPDGGRDTNKIVIIFNDNRKTVIHTIDKAQTDELAELLKEMLGIGIAESEGRNDENES